MTTPNVATGPLLREVARLYVRAQRTQSACCDGASNVQCQVLTELLRNDGLTQRALVARLGLDKGWISRAVDALVDQAAITKTQNERDRRSVTLSLTAAGIARVEKLERQLSCHAAQLLESIPPDRHLHVQESLQLLLRALQVDGPESGKDAPRGMQSTTALVIRSATARDWPIISNLLSAAALPLDGAREHLDHFVVATVDGQLVGAAGLEIYGANALLRSVVVDERCRGMSYGLALMARITKLANERGVTQLFLLTTTAARYFSNLGFMPAMREEVPEAVRQSRQFQGACPASATLLTAPTDV